MNKVFRKIPLLVDILTFQKIKIKTSLNGFYLGNSIGCYKCIQNNHMNYFCHFCSLGLT